MRMRLPEIALVGLVTLAACDLGTEPALPPIQEAEIAQLAADAADRAGSHALSLESLLRRMYEALKATPNAKAQELLDASTALAKQAREASVAGDKARATTLATQSQAKLLEAVVLVLGPGVSRDAVAAARAMLTDLKAKLAGKAVPEKTATQIAALERRLAEGEGALAQGKNVDALSIALTVAAEVGGLAGRDPVADAAKVVEEAAAWLSRARTTVGANSAAEIAALLAKAEQLLKQAQDALKAGDQASALKLATESMAISQKLAGFARDTPYDAARAVEEAAGWLAKAKATVGTNPSAEVAALLAKAEQLLKQAQEALKAGDKATALKLATESLGISMKLAVPVRETPDAAKVVEEAAAWLNRAKTVVGAGPSAEIAALLAKAEQLLKQAQEALRAGDKAAALKLATESIGISQKLAGTAREPADPAKVIEEAAGLLAKAKAAVGATPPADLAALLARAEQLLTQARDALKSGDRTTALKLANESAEISRRLIPTDRKG